MTAELRDRYPAFSYYLLAGYRLSVIPSARSTRFLAALIPGAQIKPRKDARFGRRVRLNGFHGITRSSSIATNEASL